MCGTGLHCYKCGDKKSQSMKKREEKGREGRQTSDKGRDETSLSRVLPKHRVYCIVLSRCTFFTHHLDTITNIILFLTTTNTFLKV